MHGLKKLLLETLVVGTFAEVLTILVWYNLLSVSVFSVAGSNATVSTIQLPFCFIYRPTLLVRSDQRGPSGYDA